MVGLEKDCPVSDTQVDLTLAMKKKKKSVFGEKKRVPDGHNTVRNPVGGSYGWKRKKKKNLPKIKEFFRKESFEQSWCLARFVVIDEGTEHQEGIQRGVKKKNCRVSY